MMCLRFTLRTIHPRTAEQKSKSTVTVNRMVTRKFKQQVQLCDTEEIIDDTIREQIQILTQTEVNKILAKQCTLQVCSESQASEQTSSSRKRLLLQELTSEAWIQCDNHLCQKWRRIPQSELDKIDLDQKWFCHQNNNKNYNSCDIQEENHREYDRLADNIGVKYIFSELPEGTLVWAKMSGYCRWPALITKDPDFPFHIVYDSEYGCPVEYHVEFLGSKHSHRWINIKFIEVYGHKEDINASHCMEQSVRTKKNQTQKLCRKRRSLLLCQSTKKKIGKISVSDAIEEADKLLMFPECERLKSCCFKPKNNSPFDEQPVQSTTLDCMNRNLKHSADQSRCTKLQSTSAKITPTLNVQKQGDRKEHKDIKHLQKEGCKKCNNLKKNKSNELVPQKVPDSISDQYSEEKNISKPKMMEKLDQSDAIVPCNNLLSNLNCSLVGKTKEEKFKIDIEMYCRNERAFEHDVTRFMKRNDLTLQRTPVWRQTPVTLFQMFLAVYERGGYHQVTNKRLWAAVFRELTETQEFNGCQIKKYYERNLLPYELYINGHEYEGIVKKMKHKKKRHKQKAVEKVKKLAPKITSDTDVHSLQSETSADLQEMLADLENVGNMCQYYDDYCQEEGIGKLDLTFIDETPPKKMSPNIKEANTASEFGVAYFPGESAHCVPQVLRPEEHDDAEDNEDIFHEMQALEEEIDALESEMLNIY